MPPPRAKLNITAQPTLDARPQPVGTITCGTVAAVRPDGLIDVRALGGEALTCAWLESAGNIGIVLAAGDAVLMSRYAEDAPPVVIGRIGRYGQPTAHVAIEAGQTLALKCGASSIDLRADGKVMIRGEDVLVRAKGTNRIRAGSVAIN